LIDQLTVMTFPVVLGGGKRLFGGGTPAKTIKLVEHKVTGSGAVIATYEPGGEVEQGWAGPQSTSAREVERQRRMAEGSW
jgi:dihydrofolate reductase